MSYKVVIIEEKDKYILRYPSGDEFGTFVTEEFPKDYDSKELGKAIATRMQLNKLVVK